MVVQVTSGQPESAGVRLRTTLPDAWGLRTRFCVCACIVIACLAVSERDCLAGVDLNCSYDLAGLPDPVADWTASGTGSRGGTRLEGERYYSRHDLDLSNGREFLLEAVVRAEDLPVGTTHAAGMIIIFPQAAAGPGAPVYHLEVRLRRNPGGNRAVVLVDVATGVPSDLCSLALDWHLSDHRIRVKRSKEGPTDEIYLQAEALGSWDDPEYPYGTGALSQPVAVVRLATNSVEGPTVAFGNAIPGTVVDSHWQSVHVTTCDAAHTQLPYWPVPPPVPVLAFMDQGWNAPQRVDVTVDCSAVAYLASDVMTCVLVTAKNGTKRTPPFPASSMTAVTNRFGDLSDRQTVSSHAEVQDVSGRKRVSGSASTPIPNRTKKGPMIQSR